MKAARESGLNGHVNRIRRIVMCAATLVVGCGSTPPPLISGGSGASSIGGSAACSAGDAGCACYPNATCNGSLVCTSGLCANDASSAGGSNATAGGANGAAGTSGDSSQAGTSAGGTQAIEGDAGSGAGGSPIVGGAAGSSSGGTSAAGAGGAYLFFDGFESNADLSVFSSGPSTATHTIANGGAVTGSAHHVNIMGSDAPFGGLNYEFPAPVQPSVVRWWIRIPSTGSDAYFALSGDTRAQDQIIYLSLTYVASAPLVTLQSHAGPGLNALDDGTTPLTVNTWYHFELDVNWAAGTYALKIDDNVLLNAVAFSAAGFQRIDLFTVSTPGNTDFDDIEMLP